ncbi:hypothetical protein NEMBOFW57_000386 [Staphylotrichum longicolle]|uniref:Kinetochore-associated protein MTW1 n=1 Tax=Staphylotrichum longicolle TaxID=669026 RepID=A0AAD4I0V6_9PEZI|nr:hypothetical protein NEMBOFW57_000386 [Staphylotrichum longicolle]
MASRPDTELLTEHFGYPPVSLLDEIINSINFLAERALHSIEQGLLNAPPASLGFRPSSKSQSQTQTTRANGTTQQQRQGEDAAEGESEQDAAARRHRDEIESGTHQLETLLWASIDKNFDRFEIYVMRNILCLKGGGRWSGSAWGITRGWTFRRGGGGRRGEGRGLGWRGGVNKLRRRLQASQRLGCMLGGAGAERGAAGRDAEAGTAAVSVLHDKGDLTEGDAETPLTTTAAFSLSQLQALRELSKTLRRGMADLAAAGEEAEEEEGGKKTWRRERLEYVETATRKHLENVRGLELGKNGEVRDGEWDGGGRSLAKGEVESLERVVTILGGSGNAQDRMDES